MSVTPRAPKPAAARLLDAADRHDAEAALLRAAAARLDAEAAERS